MSIAASVLDAVRAESALHGGARVTRAGLRIGELSGVAVESLRFCLEVLVADTDLAALGFEIELAPGTRRCRACAAVFRVMDARHRRVHGANSISKPRAARSVSATSTSRQKRRLSTATPESSPMRNPARVTRAPPCRADSARTASRTLAAMLISCKPYCKGIARAAASLGRNKDHTVVFHRVLTNEINTLPFAFPAPAGAEAKANRRWSSSCGTQDTVIHRDTRGKPVPSGAGT